MSAVGRIAGPRRRILFLAPFPPNSEGTHGGARVTGGLIERVAERHDVALLCLHSPAEAAMPAALREQLVLYEEVERPDRQSTRLKRAAALGRAAPGLLATRPAWVSDWRVPAFGRRVGELTRSWRPDVVQAEFHLMGQYLAGLAGRGPALVLVEHEPGAAAAADRARRDRGIRRITRRLDAAAWRRYERGVVGAADAVVTFTEDDRRSLRELAPAARIECIPLGVDVPDQPLDPIGADPPRVVLIGNFTHPPNVQAALDLATGIYPTVRARFPGATLELVGENAPPAVRRLAKPGIVVTGAVADARPHLDRATIVAVPARIGGGMRVKVLDALAAGKAVVATPRALAGVDLVPGKHAAVAESDDELADAIVALLTDPQRRRRMGLAAREWAQAHLRWDDALDAYDLLYASLPTSTAAAQGGETP
ncbi:MAG TPA: glycosyltransferase family 4 protein [Thermoleophilaceae bacterium]|nr:glycosyltransferase family 4 protein [Thermoleophilaceae bacterium]